VSDGVDCRGVGVLGEGIFMPSPVERHRDSVLLLI